MRFLFQYVQGRLNSPGASWLGRRLGIQAPHASSIFKRCVQALSQTRENFAHLNSKLILAIPSSPSNLYPILQEVLSVVTQGMH